MKILPVEDKLFHADGQTDRQTDMTNLTVAFSNFVTAPKNGAKFENSTTVEIFAKTNISCQQNTHTILGSWNSGI